MRPIPCAQAKAHGYGPFATTTRQLYDTIRFTGHLMPQLSTNIRDAFLGVFEGSGFKSNIVEYGKMVTRLSRNVDVIMLMARKAVCLVESLEATRLTTLYCPVVSDRILDTDVSWLKGKRVAICDDALISGTTLYRTAERLHNAGVRTTDVTTKVLCINTKWHSPDLVEPDGPYLELSDVETASLCARIVDAISIVPRPYAVDYPLYKGLRLPLRDIDALAALFDWTLDDISSPIQVTNGVFSLTLTPTESLRCDLDASLGWPFSQFGLHKIRLYGRLAGQGRQFYWCSMFPIVALDPLTVTEVGQLFESLAAHTGSKRAFTKSFVPRGLSPEVRSDCESTAKMRTIAYVAAARLATLWHTVLQRTLSTKVNLTQDPRTLAYLFPPDTIDRLSDLASSTLPLFKHASRSALRPAAKPADAIPEPVRAPDIFLLESVLTKPFLDLYRTKELRTRELVLKHGRSVFGMSEFKELLDRLTVGFTLPDLRQMVAQFSDVIRTEKLVSLFLDRSIDKGIAVPITATRDGFVYRAYRHGEDVEFGEAEENLCVNALDRLSKTSRRDELPRTWVEKFLVLLIRIGLEQQIFNSWDHTLGDYDTVGIRYSLHGAVTALNSPQLYLPHEYQGLPELMREHGYLEASDPSGFWKVKAVPRTGVHAERLEKVRLVGSLMGRVLGDNGADAHLKDDELVVLATCLYPRDIAGAMAAEVAIISRLWKYAGKEYWTQSVSGLTKDAAVDLLGRLRQSSAFVAAHSGTWKFTSFWNRTGWQIIARIAGGLSDEIHQSAWNSLWPQEGRHISQMMTDELRVLIRREGEWLYRVRALQTMIEIVLAQTVGPDIIPPGSKRFEFLKRKAVERFAREIRESVEAVKASAVAAGAQTRATQLLSKAARKLESSYATQKIELAAVYEFATTQLKHALAEAPEILGEVDAVAASFGRPDQVSFYPHVLYISLISNGISRGKHIRSAQSIFYEIRKKAATMHQGQPAYLAYVPNSEREISDGLWICASGNLARTWLIRLALEIMRVQNDGCSVKCILFLHLPPGGGLVRACRSTAYTGELFWKNAKKLLASLGTDDRTGVVTTLVDDSKGDAAGVHHELMLESKNSFVEASEPVKTILEWPSNNPGLIRQYIGKRDANAGRTKLDVMDIGILTVTGDEIVAVREFLKERPRYSERAGAIHNRTFYEGVLKANDDSGIRVVATRALVQGNRSITAAYRALVDEYSPRVVVLLGIAGGIHKDVKLCDVVIADSVVYYDRRAETEVGTKHRLEAFSPRPAVRMLINRFVDEHGDSPRLESAAASFQGHFNIVVGPIGCGEAVVKYRDSEIRTWLQRLHDKVLAVETEAAGVSQQFDEDELRRDITTKGVIVIRGISDHADEEKDDRWRKPAVHNAMKCLEAITSLHSSGALE